MEREHVTVNELIEILQKVPTGHRDLEVRLEGCDCNSGASGLWEIEVNEMPDRLSDEAERWLLLKRGDAPKGAK